jgi:hypothetical protein
MKNNGKLWLWILSFGFILVISCNSPSILRENANDRYEEYKSAYKHYSDSETDYIILLSNLERYPKDEYLLMRKQLLRKEIEQNRLLMLQTRVEFEKALQEWDFEVQKRETGVPTDSIDIRQIFGLPTPKDTSLRYRE